MPEGERIIISDAEVVPVVCSVCKKTFHCPPNQASRREVCCKPHQGPWDNCCSCVAKMRKEQHPKIEFMTSKETRQFLKAARKVGIEFYLAFRLAINGMLNIHDLLKLKTTSLKIFRGDETKPCILKVGDASVELDCETLSAIEEWCGNHDKLFPIQKRAFQRAYRETLSIGNIYEYTFHALRHTGIMLRAQCVRNLTDLESLRRAARFKSLEGLKPYLMAVESSLTSRVRFV